MKDNMNEEFRLYVGCEISYYSTLEEAKKAATAFMPSRAELRIEVLVEIEPWEADFWAYNYDEDQWEPS